jgi:hypothetical protein
MFRPCFYSEILGTGQLIEQCLNAQKVVGLQEEVFFNASAFHTTIEERIENPRTQRFSSVGFLR